MSRVTQQEILKVSRAVLSWVMKVINEACEESEWVTGKDG